MQVVAEYVTVGLLADVFGRDTHEIAERIVTLRKKPETADAP